MKQFLFLLVFPIFLQAQPTEPILTLNTMMHTSVVRRVNTDARGRFMLTCSGDKTARLWDIRTGSLIRILRPPIGVESEGRIDAGAISPDGRIAAVVGWTGYEWDNQISIYLFDLTTGGFIRRINTKQSQVVADLEFSADGRYLAAACLGGAGIKIYRSIDWELQAQDTDYGANSNNVAFDAWGRLASASMDGYVRLYDANFNLVKKVAPTGGKQPFSVAYSPDGRLLAVGFDDSPTIQVLDANTLALRYAPNVTGTDAQDRLEMLTFSFDGSKLAAGYGYQKYKDGAWCRQIRLWSDGGKGTYLDVDAGKGGVMDIKALSSGGFIYGGVGYCGVMDENGQRLRHIESDLQDYNTNDKSHFRVSAGGEEIGITPMGGTPLKFVVKERQLLDASSSASIPITTRGDIIVSDWQNTFNPKLNGKTLTFLERFEQNRSASIATGGVGVVLGADWNLYCIDVDGQLRWEQPCNAEPWCVNVDPTNQVVAAGLGDGTIRWYRFRDGKPLLTLYIHPDRKRWVLWTPSGYFDCAPGAEDFLGWHVNQGPAREALYYPLSKFRDRYYRPDVIDRILETLDETYALEEADKARGKSGVNTRGTVLDELPPNVRILGPSEGTEINSTKLTLSYSLQSPNNEAITGVRILIDGRPIATGRGFKPLNQRLEEPIEVPAANCTVSVIAENRFGSSEAASIHLFWKNTSLGVSAPGIDVRPKLYVLSIGVSKYQNADMGQLDYADDDARDFAALLQKQKGGLYQDVKTRVLIDGAATKESILDGLEWLEQETTSRDVAMLFFAGHGVDDRSGNFYYLPSNVDPSSLKRTGVAHGDVQTTVASVAGKIVVFMDACHSGSLMRPIGTVRGDILPEIAPVINELISAENGAVVFCSTTNRQKALEDAKWGHGAFTKALLEGLGGKACAPGTKKVTLKTLDAYVAERVKELTNRLQTPTTTYPPNVPDFPISFGN